MQRSALPPCIRIPDFRDFPPLILALPSSNPCHFSPPTTLRGRTDYSKWQLIQRRQPPALSQAHRPPSHPARLVVQPEPVGAVHEGVVAPYLHEPLGVVLHDVLQQLEPLHGVVVVERRIPLHGVGHVGAGGRAAVVHLRQEERVAAGAVLNLILPLPDAVHALPKVAIGCG